jgi:hypothetical protein
MTLMIKKVKNVKIISASALSIRSKEGFCDIYSKTRKNLTAKVTGGI